MIAPRIAYGAHVWARSKNTSKIKEVTDKLDRVCAKYAKGIFKTTDALWLENNLTHRPCIEVIKKTAFLFFVRKLTHLGSSADTRTDLQKRLMQQPAADASAVNACISRYLNLLLLKEEAVANTQTLVNEAKHDEALIFTDGSFDEKEGGGAAAHCWNNHKTISITTGNNVLHSNHECKTIGLLAAFMLIKRLTNLTPPPSFDFKFSLTT